MNERWLGAIALAAVIVATPAVVVQAQTIDDLYLQGNAAQAEGNYAEAEQIWRQIIRRTPNDAIAYYNLGNVLADQERLEEAEAAYRQAISLNLNDAEAYNNLGYLAQTQGRLEEAIALYPRALAIDPNLRIAQRNLSEAQRLLP